MMSTRTKVPRAQNSRILQITFKTLGDPQADHALIVGEAAQVWPQVWCASMDRTTQEASGEVVVWREIVVCRDAAVMSEGEMAGGDVLLNHLRAGDTFIIGHNSDKPYVIMSECSPTKDTMRILNKIRTAFSNTAPATIPELPN